MKCLLHERTVNDFMFPNMGSVSDLVIGIPLPQLIIIITSLQIMMTLANKQMSSEVRSYFKRLRNYFILSDT
jgi:hypothetical protein